jgi:hypothetical protein
VLVAAGAALLIGLVVWLIVRSSKSRSLAERQRLIAATVAGWTAQGWAIESQTPDSAVLRRGGEVVLVSVDPDGRIVSRPLGGPPPGPPREWDDDAPTEPRPPGYS